MRHDSWNLTGAKRPTDARSGHRLLAEEFDAWADAGRGASMERGHLPTAGQVLERIDFATMQVFLDVGTGNGYAVRHAASRMPADGVAIGLDLSPRMLAVAREATVAYRDRAQREGQALAETRFVEAPFSGIPLADRSADVVFSNEAIYYAPDVNAALREVQRVLKPGGRFYCGLDFYEENRYSHDWADKVGVPMLLDSESGWRKRFEAIGFQAVTTERLMDPGPVPEPPADADPAALERHADLVAWKREIGTLLVTGTRI